MGDKKVSEIEVKKGIIRMYEGMERFCRLHSECAKENIDEFEIKDLKNGYEFKTVDGDKYQLVLELKKV